MTNIFNVSAKLDELKKDYEYNINSLKESIKILETKISKLQNPFKYKVGDKITTVMNGYDKNTMIKGGWVVVDREFQSGSKYDFASNRYTLYNEKKKVTINVIESQIIN